MSKGAKNRSRNTYPTTIKVTVDVVATRYPSVGLCHSLHMHIVPGQLNVDAWDMKHEHGRCVAALTTDIADARDEIDQINYERKILDKPLFEIQEPTT